MDFNLPELGEGVYEAEAVRWLVQPGQTVRPGQAMLEMLTDKATMEVPAPFAGTIERLLVSEGQKVKIGAPILSYRPAAEEAVAVAVDNKVAAASASSLPASPAHVNGPSQASAGTVKAAPSVRLMARKLGVDLSKVHGSGPQGRVLIEDLTQHVPSSSGKASNDQPAAADFGKPGTRIKLAGLRRKIAEHMTKAAQTIPHYSYVDECDVTDLVKLRDLLKEPYARQGVKLTYLAFLAKAVVGALKEVPIVNASLDEAAGEIVLHDRYHLGIAVAVSGGLIVPVLHDADKLSLVELAREIDRLSTAARAGKSKLEELRGGTFAITSIGNLGGLFATPIIDHPQVGILGVGKIVRRPVFDEHEQVKPADMLYLSFAFDHRVLDGAVGCAFGNAVIKRLSAPGELLVG